MLNLFIASDVALSLEVLRGIKILESLGLGRSLELSTFIVFPLTSDRMGG
jgi:hypothetical protein